MMTPPERADLGPVLAEAIADGYRREGISKPSQAGRPLTSCSTSAPISQYIS